MTVAPDPGKLYLVVVVVVEFGHVEPLLLLLLLPFTHLIRPIESEFGLNVNVPYLSQIGSLSAIDIDSAWTLSLNKLFSHEFNSSCLRPCLTF